MNKGHHQADLDRIKKFRLMDDDFMNACFDGNIEATELILRIILNRQDINVTQVTTQKVMKNLMGRDVWLDIFAKDKKNETLNQIRVLTVGGQGTIPAFWMPTC